MSDLGTVERADAGELRVRYVRHYEHPPEKVWRALVDPEELKHWFPAAIEGERRQGAKLRFVFEGEDGPAAFGTLRVFDPPRVLEFNWDKEVLRFELTPERGGCKLVFITSFVDRVTAPRSAAGWHRCLGALGERLGVRAKTDDVPWHDLYRRYSEALGPGDYPAFVRDGGELIRSAMHTPGLEGVAYRGARDVRIELLRATCDADTPAYTAAPNEYLLVLEGRYELSLGGGHIVLEGGMEFAFPEGFTVSGKVKAGTRLLRALSD